MTDPVQPGLEEPDIGPERAGSPAPTRRQRIRRLLLDFEPLRRDRDFRWLWFGQLVSGTGRQVTLVALWYEVFTITQRDTGSNGLASLSVGALSIVQLVAILAFALTGGAIADAVDRRRLILVAQLSLAATSVAFLWLSLLPKPPVLGFYAVAFLAAGLGAVDQPARSSAIPRLVPRQRLAAAISLGQLSFQTIAIVGPSLGGILIGQIGVPAAFAFDVVTFAAAIVAALVIAPIPPAPDATPPTLRSIAEGLRFTRARRIVLATFVIDLDAMIFGMPQALFPALALTVFGVGAEGLGVLISAPSVGALLGAVMTGWTGRVRKPGLAVVVAVAGWGAAITAFGLLTVNFALALVCLAVAGAADVISAVLRNAIVQLETPDRLRGRLMSIHTLVVTSGPRLGDAEATLVAALAGPQFSVVSGGILCLIGLGAVVRAFPELLTHEMPVHADGAI